MQPSLELKTGDASVLKFEIAKQLKEEPIELEKILAGFSEAAFFDTGLNPRQDSGLINYRKAAGYETFVFQVAPGRNKVIWGTYEGDTDAKTYTLAMPYRIIIGDHMWNGKAYDLVGARHFYSYKPVTSWDDVMYNCNVPNLNCRGYSDNGVGWICLYHRESYAGYDLKKRIMATCMRTAGGEAYNDNNMSGTDGTRYYKAKKKPEYFWNPVKWQAKTEKEGWEWTLDKDLLIPVKIQNPAKNEMQKNIEGANAKEASLFDLTRGLYRAYYNHPIVLKPHNLMDPDNPFVGQYEKSHVKHTYKTIVEFFDGSLRGIKTVKTKGWTPKIVKIKCDLTGGTYPEEDQFYNYYDIDLNVKKAHVKSTKGMLVNAYVKLNGTLAHVKMPKDIVVTLGPPGPTIYVHPSLEYSTCNRCNKRFIDGAINTKQSIDHIKEHGYCAECRDKIQCTSCSRSFFRGTEAIVTPSPKTQILIEDIKRSIVLSAKQGTAIEPKTTKINEVEPQILCSYCAPGAMMCMCGHLITNRDAAGVCQTMKNNTVVCKGCTIMDAGTKDIQHIPRQIIYGVTKSATAIMKLNAKPGETAVGITQTEGTKVENV